MKKSLAHTVWDENYVLLHIIYNMGSQESAENYFRQITQRDPRDTEAFVRI